MELLYLWIKNDGITIKDQGFNFSNQINFELSQVTSKSAILKFAENPNYIADFFNGNATLVKGTGEEINFVGGIVNVTAIIGENGLGKTNLLHFIINLINDDLPIGEEFIVVFKDIEHNTIKTFHTLEDFQLGTSGNITDFIIENPIMQKWEILEPFGSIFKSPANFGLPGNIIFYSPIFDFRNHNASISSSNIKYINVSTSSLIKNDQFKHGDSFGEEIDKLLVHKYCEVRRQFELSLAQTADLSFINIPKTLDIVFYRNHFNPKEGQRNLTYQSEAIFNDLDELIVKEFGIINGQIHEVYEKKRINSELENNTALESLLKKKLQVEFTYSLIHNYFKNLSAHFNEDIGISIDDMKGNGLLERSKYFFHNQKWKGNSKQFIPTGSLFDLIIDLIKDLDFEKYPISDNSNSFTIDNVNAIEVLNKYELYITALPNNHVKHFLAFNWRGISSGENALLNLYSRLFFAKKERLDKIKDLKIKSSFIYLLIDEGEIGFHPKWQSMYLKNLLDFVYYCFPEYHVQIILTSHSPFIVSDLPKNNLIFLRRNGNLCEVTNFEEKETFATNIHTLFSNNFFMENSVIGEFAKNKLLKELNPLLNNKNGANLNIKRLTKIINLIGDPLIRAKLNDMLEKFKPEN